MRYRMSWVACESLSRGNGYLSPSPVLVDSWSAFNPFFMAEDFSSAQKHCQPKLHSSRCNRRGFEILASAPELDVV